MSDRDREKRLAFLNTFEDAIQQGDMTKAREVFDAEAAGLFLNFSSEEYSNIRIAGLVRYSYCIRHHLPDYKKTVDKAYQILATRMGQERAARILINLIEVKSE